MTFVQGLAVVGGKKFVLPNPFYFYSITAITNTFHKLLMNRQNLDLLTTII